MVFFTFTAEEINNVVNPGFGNLCVCGCLRLVAQLGSK